MAQVNIRMDDELKTEAEELFNELGLNLSSAITVFVTQAVRERRIPFEITAEKDPFYSPANIARLKESIEQMERTGGTIRQVNYDD